MLLQVFREGAQREGRKAQREREKERQSGTWTAHALRSYHGAWVEEGSSNNTPFTSGGPSHPQNPLSPTLRDGARGIGLLTCFSRGETGPESLHVACPSLPSWDLS